ncbi:MAG: DUF222 domain-containing protein [Nocardioides sp.]
MSTSEKATALTRLAALKSQMTELELRVLAAAADVAETTAARDVGVWLHAHTHSRPEDARADLALAIALDRDHHAVAAAIRQGACNPAQARVIVDCLDDLPGQVDTETRTHAEEALVDYATRFDPHQLRRLGRHILDVIAPEVAEQVEADRLQDEEAHARTRTRLTLRPLGDGTTQITGLLPDPIAHRLATYLHAYTNPRKGFGQTGDRAGETDRAGESHAGRLPYPRRLGQAFCQLLETLDPTRLPLHGGDATTVTITITLDSLRHELGHGAIIGGDTISAAEVRRLACTANIIPLVLGGHSEILDLGRARRVFDKAQRKALLLRDQTCRAEDCTIPGTWCEAHHWVPWAKGGSTDLANAVLLCNHHHHRAHDHTYDKTRLPNGDVRFARRR